MKKYLLTLLIFSGGLCSLQAATTTLIGESYTSGTTTGTVNWSDPIWAVDASSPSGATAAPPVNDATNLYSVKIDHTDASAANLTLNTPGTATTLSRLNIAQGASGNFTLKLGANLTILNSTFTISGYTTPTNSFTNTSTTASQLVIDLNGHTFDGNLGSFTNTLKPSFTLMTSSGTASVFKTNAFGTLSASTPSVTVGNNVTVMVTSQGANFTSSSFSSGSTIDLEGGSGATIGNLNSTVLNYGNLIIGTTTATTAALSGLNGQGRTVQFAGNILIGANSTVGLGNSTTGITGLKVQGNYTDNNTTNASYQSAAASSQSTTTSLNGGYTPATPALNERTLSVAHSLLASSGGTVNGLVTNFQVGDGTLAGNAKLVVNASAASSVGALNTLGSLKVFGDSRLNLGSNLAANAGNPTVTAASINIVTGATIATILSTTSSGATLLNGYASTSGVLTLNTFNLQLDYDGTTWINGSNLVLFNYGTHAAGLTPTITSIASGYTITWGSLTDDTTNHQIVLSGVNIAAIPEPSAALLIVAFGGLVAWTIRRKSRQA
ncbi:MAG: hypothetical protein ABI443_03695 [Chthoniobacterales bacterium]